MMHCVKVHFVFIVTDKRPRTTLPFFVGKKPNVLVFKLVDCLIVSSFSKRNSGLVVSQSYLC